jgi:aerobic carbon-monoxide dehydrogenase small subunit
MRVMTTVNGTARTADTEPRTSLLDFIRDTLGLTATHMGCEHGVCGACTVLLDGVPVRSCLIYAVQAEGHAVTTAEALRTDDGSPGPLMDAFMEAHGLQCGYCTPGMLISAQALLARTPNPSDDDIREAIGGNLCRCTGYAQIIEAIRLAAERMR